MGSTVAVQHEDWGAWTHGTITKHESDDHHGRSYKIRVTKMGQLITRTK